MDVAGDGSFYPLSHFLDYGADLEWDLAPRLCDCEGLSKEEIRGIREAARLRLCEECEAADEAQEACDAVAAMYAPYYPFDPFSD